jgi:diaminopimelate decarboxylase
VFILFYVDKFGTIVILTLISIFAFIIYKFTRKKVELLGKEGELSQNISDCNVVGPVCESGDFFAKDYLLPPLEHNDLVIVNSAGAYGFGMGSNYNTRGRSAEVALQNGEVRLIRRRETFEDLIALETEFLEK